MFINGDDKFIPFRLFLLIYFFASLRVEVFTITCFGSLLLFCFSSPLRCVKHLSSFCLATFSNVMEKLDCYLKFSLFSQLIFKYLIVVNDQEGLNKKEIQLNLCNIFSIFIFNELYLFV